MREMRPEESRDSSEVERSEDAGQAEDASTETVAMISGRKLSAARREAGLTQRELAKRLGIKLWVVDEWEAGRLEVDADQIEPLASVLGSPSENLLEPETEAEPTAELPELSEEEVELPPVPEGPEWSAEQIRSVELPKSRRGFDETATRRLLDEIAAGHERMTADRQRLEHRVAELEADLESRKDYEQVTADRNELQRWVEELEASVARRQDYDEIVAERDKLQARVTELDAALEILKDYELVVNERNELQSWVEELEKSLPSSEEVEQLNGERDGLRQRVAELEAEVQRRDEAEQALSKALVAASRAGEQLLEEARAEAESIVAEAHRSTHELEEQRRNLESQRESLVRDFRREALEGARDDLAELQRSAEPVATAFAALIARIAELRRLELGDGDGDEPGDDVGEIVEDLHPHQPDEHVESHAG
jgi:cell division septum initiation protein DivIVA/DNA-binding transcriptional regulator YiaG